MGPFGTPSSSATAAFVGRNDNGYAPFTFDLTDFLFYGQKNCITCSHGCFSRGRLVLRGRGYLSPRGGTYYRWRKEYGRHPSIPASPKTTRPPTVIAASLQTCGVVLPFAIPTSICRSKVTICSGLCLLMAMNSFLLGGFSHSTWYKKRRSRHCRMG
jgi:hypothetical protein